MKTQEQIIAEATEKANALIAKGSKLSFEKLLASYIISLTPKVTSAMTSKDVAKMERSNRIAQDVANFVESGKSIDNSDLYAAAALRQRGSSMR